MIRDFWFTNSIVYSLDLETYLDADGDGVGDFEGLVRRIDYLHSLGVDTIWLSPFQPTPNRDNGYDISDYYGVDPRHGSSGDFVTFMNTAERRGIRVLIDLVVNHTSNEHRWFREARRDRNSRYRSWYIWSKDRPPDSDEGMVFPGVQETTWTFDDEAQEHYFHRFFSFQPDLKIENPEVRAEILRIMGYWIQLGVAGFRIDALPFVLEKTMPGAKPEMMFELLKEMRDFLQWRRGDAVLLGEANVLPEDIDPYFAGGEGANLIFNFYVNQHLFYALASGDAAPLAEALQATRDLPDGVQWANFLRNHDELDLGRLTAEQRQTVFERFAPDESMQLYGRGIRRRLAPMLKDRPLLELAHSMLFALPGTPVIWHGDEIGMGDDLSLDGRNAVRTPMQWSDDFQAGFSACDETVRPVISEGQYSYQRVNVESQRRDPQSLLNWMASMIRLRKECPEVGSGDWSLLETGSPNVLAIRYDWRGSSLIVVHNFSDQPRQARIEPGVSGGEHLVNLLVENDSHADDDGVHTLQLNPYGYQWLRVGSLARVLHRARA